MLTANPSMVTVDGDQVVVTNSFGRLANSFDPLLFISRARLTLRDETEGQVVEYRVSLNKLVLAATLTCLFFLPITFALGPVGAVFPVGFWFVFAGTWYLIHWIGFRRFVRSRLSNDDL